VDAARDVGLPIYPGAKPKPPTPNDKNSANVNISTAFFGLRVAVVEFVSDDSPAKVAQFYRKELLEYGSVVECHSNWDSVTDVHKDKSGSHELHCDGPSTGDTLELKVGTEERQHVVAIKPSGSGTEFALVYVSTRGKGEAL
jgi:hypothetical protein